jgi:hypothetical protein
MLHALQVSGQGRKDFWVGAVEEGYRVDRKAVHRLEPKSYNK